MHRRRLRRGVQEGLQIMTCRVPLIAEVGTRVLAAWGGTHHRRVQELEAINGVLGMAPGSDFPMRWLGEYGISLRKLGG